MTLKKIYCMIFVINSVLITVLSAPPELRPEHNSRSFRNALNQQGIQTILQSIEDRLRNLDQIYSLKYSQRVDLNTDQYVRKIEMLETKLSRMESLLEVQLEKLSENMSSKNFRDDVTKDQIFRKMDSVYERINHKLSYMEGKFDMDILKLQSKIEAGLTKTDRLDHSISVRQADIELEISEGVELIETVKNSVNTLEQKWINITKYSQEHLQEKYEGLINTKLNNITYSLRTIEQKIENKSQERQNDCLNDYSNKGTPLSIQSYGNKINNMYNELWQKSTSIENTVKNSIQLMNLTRTDIQDNMNNLLQKSESKFKRDSQNDGNLQIMVDSFTNILQRKMSELGRKMESNFENIMATQNLFLDSCHRIQIDETQLESKISLILEKLLDSFTSRSIMTFKELQNIQDVIKYHDNNIHRTINQNTDTMIKLSEKTSEDRKKIEKILSTMKKEIGNVMTSIENEINIENLEKKENLDTIGNILLELQAQVNDLDGKMNKDYINYNAKQMLQDVLLQTKDTFTKQLNISILHNTEIIAKVDDILKVIYKLLNNIDTKINQCADAEFQFNKLNSSEINSINKQEISKVEDNIDIILDVFADKYNITDRKRNLFLSRFNYTVVDNKNKTNDSQIIENEHSHENSEDESDISDEIIINGFSATDVPVVTSTFSNLLNNGVKNVHDKLDLKMSSPDENSTQENRIIINGRIEESTNITDKDIKETTNDSRYFENDNINQNSTANTEKNKTNKFINEDKLGNRTTYSDLENLVNKSKLDTMTNDDNISEIFTSSLITEITSSNYDVNTKIDNVKLEERKTNVVADILDKIYESFKNLGKNGNSNEFNDFKQFDNIDDTFDTVATTTDMADNPDDYDDEFDE